MKWSNPEGTILLGEVQVILDVTNYKLYKAIRKKSFPKPINLGKRLVWRKSEVIEWKKKNLKTFEIKKLVI